VFGAAMAADEEAQRSKRARAGAAKSAV